MWLGELITERGVGNGMSVLIFTQIAATFPSALWSLKVARPGSQGWVVFLLVIALGLLVMIGVIFVELSQRRIPVQYAKRMVGRRMFGGTTHLHPDQGQPGRRHTRHLRLVAAVSAGSVCPVPAG